MTLHQTEIQEIEETSNIMDLINGHDQIEKHDELLAQEPFELVTVGIFSVPGIQLVKEFITDELHDTMYSWSVSNQCGDHYDKLIWYFKSESQRDQFLEEFKDAIESSAAEFKRQGISDV